MRKHIYLFLLLLISSVAVSAQVSLKKRLTNVFFAHFMPRGAALLDTEAYKNKAFIFGMAIGVNDKGVVDTVIFSNQTKELDEIVNFAKTIAYLKKNTAFRDQKNSLLVANVFIRREWDSRIENLDSLSTYFDNLLPKLGKLQDSRKIKLIESINLTQFKPKY